MASIEEIEAQAGKPGVDLEFDLEEGSGDLKEDFFEATTLIARTRTLLEFMSDQTLCKGLTKRERESMGRLAVELTQFLDNVEGIYDEEFEE